MARVNVTILPSLPQFVIVRCNGLQCEEGIGVPLPLTAGMLLISMAMHNWITWGTDDDNGDPIARCYCNTCAKDTLPSNVVALAEAINKQVRDNLRDHDLTSN